MGDGGEKFINFAPTIDKTLKTKFSTLNYQLKMRFLGNIEAKTDAKGRVFLPASFRKILEAAGEEVLVLRKDIHQDCLVLYPMSVWNERLDTLMENVNPFDDEGQMILREYVSPAEELTLDANGRFLIQRKFMKMADIKQSVNFIGVDKVIEIWASEKLEQPFIPQKEFAEKLKLFMVKKPKREE